MSTEHVHFDDLKMVDSLVDEICGPVDEQWVQALVQQMQSTGYIRPLVGYRDGDDIIVLCGRHRYEALGNMWLEEGLARSQEGEPNFISNELIRNIPVHLLPEEIKGDQLAKTCLILSDNHTKKMIWSRMVLCASKELELEKTEAKKRLSSKYGVNFRNLAGTKKLNHHAERLSRPKHKRRSMTVVAGLYGLGESSLRKSFYIYSYLKEKMSTDWRHHPWSKDLDNGVAIDNIYKKLLSQKDEGKKKDKNDSKKASDKDSSDDEQSKERQAFYKKIKGFGDLEGFFQLNPLDWPEHLLPRFEELSQCLMDECERLLDLSRERVFKPQLKDQAAFQEGAHKKVAS